jgi:hypothetical protein
MTAIPVLHTERLALRGWSVEDFDAYPEMVCDPEVVCFLLTDLQSRADA